MSINVRAKTHPFKDDYAEFQCEAAPLAELYARLNSPLDISHARFLIDDEMVVDASRTPPDGSTVRVNVAPEGGGDPRNTGKATFWAGLGISALGVAALFIPIVGAALGSAVIGAGVSMTLGGAVLMNTEIPSSRGTGNQMESVRGSKNQARKLGYIPVLFGRHLVTPDAAALPYTEIDGDGRQWLVQLFCAGYNDMSIETGSFKVGDTDLLDLSQTKDINAILAGTDPRIKMEIIQTGAASALYPRICVEQQFNRILKHADDNGLPAPLTHDTPDKTARVNVDIMFPQGLVEYRRNEKRTASVSVSIQYKPDGAPDSSYSDFPGWNPNISAQTVDMFRLQATVSGLSPGKYTVKITRVTADRSSNDYIDAVYVGSVRSFAEDRPVREAAAKDLTLIALKTQASALANGIVDSFNFVAQSTIPDYAPATGAWIPRLTKNPASMLLYALQGKINPDPVADSDIDWDSLNEFWAFCNDKNYTCNAVQGDRELFSVLCAKIAKTGRASILRMNGKFSVVIDRERPAPVQLFSPRNTIDYRQTIVKADIPDEIALEFIDETSGWISNERSVYNTPDGLPTGAEKTKQSSSVWGVTDPDAAFKFARYQLACATNRPVVHSLECDIEYLLAKKGDLIEYAGDTALAGIAYGKVTAVIRYEGAAVGIAADTLFPQEPGKSYGIRCRKSNGQLVALNVVNRETSEKDLRFATPQVANILEEGDLVIFGIAGQITRRLIITEIAPADHFQATLTCVDYSPEIFSVDDPAYVVPPFDNKITASGGIADSGIVDTAEWRTWLAYHDSVDMPEKPVGGGTTGGWHRYQTPQSRWVSAKTAPSIADGDWSAPSQTSFLVDEALRALIAANPGPPGVPATVYRLIPGATVIKRYATGVIDPPTISCEQQSITGNEPPAPSNKTLKYLTERDGEETLYEGPITVGAWDFIEFRLYDDNGALLDRENVPALSDGPPATVYHLVPNVPLIVRNPSGEASPPAISCAQQVAVGNKPPEPSDKAIKYSTSTNPKEAEYADPVPVAWDWIEFRLYDGTALLDQERVFVLSEGEPARIYELQPSASVIRIHDGATDPPKIACAQASITGNGLPEPSNKTLKYAASLPELVSAANFEILHYPGDSGAIFDPMLGDFYPTPLNVAVYEQLYTDEITVNPQWEWIEFRLYDGDVLLDKERVPILSDGPPATVYHLVPSVPLIARNPSGEANPPAISCSQQVVVGNKPPESSNKRLAYTTSASSAETDYDGNPVAVAWEWIEFRLYDGAALLDQERVFVLSEGEPARIYELQPSASVVRVYDGMTDPYQIACAQASITGNGLPAPSDKTLRYATSLDDEKNYAGEITVNPAWGWIEFRLYDGDVLLDNERVPVLANGASPIYLDLANQHIAVRADEYGNPYSLPLVTQATLYNGNAPVTYEAFKAKVAAKNILHYPGNIFDPMPGDFYPTRMEQWSISRGAIDQNGIITINDLPEDQTEITVRAFYDDVEYAAALSVIKVRDGESPAVIDIENENASIACDAYGAPYPGELPFVAKAIFYKGTAPAAPFWYLNTPIRGVSIAQDGTITVAEDAGLGRSNSIPVMAAFRGKTYSRTLTITKALEGFAATAYELLPGANVIRRDAEGSYAPAAISCAQQKIVGNNLPEPANKTLAYVTSASSTEIPYTGAVTVAWDWIEFRLYDGSALLDKQRIPVISNGVNGAPSYTWIKYADTAQGGGLSDSPTGKDYIGLAYNKTTAKESDVPADYAWSLIAGKDGVPGVNGVDGKTYYTWIKYSDNADGTGLYQTPKDSTKYIGIAVNKDTAVESSVKTDYVWSLFKGADGAPSYTWIKYADTAQGGGLSDSPTGKDYIGLAYNKTTATESSNPADYLWSLMKGKDGVPGEPGADGKTYYAWIKYSDNADGTGLYDTPTAATKYIGIAVNKDTAVESSVKTDYVWSLFKGEDAITLSIENENASVKCDAYGVPYPDSLPLTTKAALWQGETLANPAWSLESPPAGVSITQDGTITVAQNAALADLNNIKVKALYKDIAYIHVLTVTKTLDGESLLYLDLANQHIAVRADEYGNPYSLPLVTQATLYNGNAPVTYEAFKAKVAAKNILHYPGNIFDPMPGDFYPTRMEQWSISRGAIDQDGVITIDDLPEDEEKITVRAFYDDVEYAAVLTVIKVKDAERPVIIDIENENTSIACDARGDPHPGELPLQTKAALYWGTELVSPFWFLEGKRGAAIAQDGIITVAQNAELADVNHVLIKAAFKGKTYARMFTLTKTRDGESPITLNIQPDNEVIQCDYQGVPLRGLPLTARATLHKGNQEITAAMELAEAARVEILHYPGNIFDPMPGDFYPALGYPITWTLVGAPAGVTIDQYGLIAVSGTAQLDDINTITVRAAYHGKTYEAAFGITKARGGAPGVAGNKGKDGDAANVPKYRGATNIADTGSAGTVTLTSGETVTMNDLDWVLFMGTANWTKARLYQWNAKTSVWIRLEPSQNMSRYMDALETITENAADGIFSNVFCQVLFAQTAAIEKLQSQIIRLRGENGITLDGTAGTIQSANYKYSEQSGLNKERSGFKLQNGYLSFVGDRINSWFMRSLKGYQPPGLVGDHAGTAYMRGGIRGMALFWYENGVLTTDLRSYEYYSGLGFSGEVSRIAAGVYKIAYVCEDSEEASALERARIFGYYVRTTKTITGSDGNSYTIPAAWGTIISSGKGIVDNVNLTVTYVFVCKDNNSDNLEEDPAYVGCIYLFG